MLLCARSCVGRWNSWNSQSSRVRCTDCWLYVEVKPNRNKTQLIQVYDAHISVPLCKKKNIVLCRHVCVYMFIWMWLVCCDNNQ